MLTKQSILSAKTKTKKVATPEWGDDGHVYVNKLKGPQIERVQELVELHGKASTNGKAMSDMELLGELCTVFVCTSGGEPVLLSKDVPKLLNGPFAPIERCVDEGLRFNHLTEDSMEKVRTSVKKNVAPPVADAGTRTSDVGDRSAGVHRRGRVRGVARVPETRPGR